MSFHTDQRCAAKCISTKCSANLHEERVDLLICEEKKMLPLYVEFIRGAWAHLCGACVTPFFHNPDVHHIQLQHLQEQKEGLLQLACHQRQDSNWNPCAPSFSQHFRSISLDVLPSPF